MLTSSGTTAASTRDEFLTLLTTQLRHQDPIEPVKQENFLQQLAQFSTLEGIEKLNANFESMLKLQRLTDGANLVGKIVEYKEANAPGGREFGIVERVSVDGGALQVEVNGQTVGLDRVVSLVNSAPA